MKRRQPVPRRTSEITNMQNVVIKSWQDLSHLIEMHSGQGWIYRGEDQLNDKLLPKAGRVGSNKGAARKLKFDHSDEEAALKMFKRQARPYVSHEPKSDLEWLAIAQHHGMSTRLLDWSESPLAACFFAVINAGVRGDGRIFGIRDVSEVSEPQEHQPFELGTVYAYRPPHITPRIPAQRSVLTIHPDPTEDFATHEGMIRWVIQDKVCGKIKRILDNLGINESSLFPDLDGLARYIGWKYKWAKF
jgi:hypothetical protein